MYVVVLNRIVATTRINIIMIKCVNNQGIFNFRGAPFMQYSISDLTLPEHSQIIRCEVDYIMFMHCTLYIYIYVYKAVYPWFYSVVYRIVH